MADIIGWDLGGAHLKAARLDDAGRIVGVIQRPCPLWQGLQHLEQAIDAALASLGTTTIHAVTMTGELVDLFSDRHEGVLRLVETLRQRLPGADLRVYAGRSGFVGPDQADTYADDIASANWLASTAYAAAHCRAGLFIDVGSTTTDIVLLADGKPQPLGHTDAERLATEELVYSGAVRTPVMAVARRVPFAGQWQRIAAEYFATMADVHRLTGNLELAHDMAPTADDAGKSPEDSARRLARMVGRDLHDAGMAEWRELAHHLAHVQLQDIRAAAERALSRGLIGADAPLVGAGAGCFLAFELARLMQREYIDFSDLVEGGDESREWAAVCAPAFSVAWLAQQSA